MKSQSWNNSARSLAGRSVWDAQPEGVVKEVIYPVVSEETLEDVIREAETDEKHEQQVKLITRSSYSHHYRRVVPVLLDVLSFQCNNERHRSVMDALALAGKTSWPKISGV